MTDIATNPMPYRMRKINGFYLAESAVLLGDITIGKDTSIWPFVSARGDVAPIRIGEGCSIQDHTCLHCKHGVTMEIGNHVLIGHHACVHCTRVGDWTLIGIGSRVLDEAIVGSHCIVAAGAVVTPGTIIPDGKLVAGVPAKVIRDVSEKDKAYIHNVVTRYVDLARDHVDGKFPPLFSPF